MGIDAFRRSRYFLLSLVALCALHLQPAQAQAAPDTTAISSATRAALAWLTLVDSGSFEESWDAAAPALQGAITKAAWAQALFTVRGPLEPFGARSLISAQFSATLPNAPPGPYVALRYRTSVSHSRYVVETVTPMHLPDGTWRVSGYYVRPSP